MKVFDTEAMLRTLGPQGWYVAIKAPTVCLFSWGLRVSYKRHALCLCFIGGASMSG